MVELNHVYCGDSLDIIKTFPDDSIDLILTDIPYNIGDANKRTKVGNNIVSNEEAWGKWDKYEKEFYYSWILDIFRESYRILNDTGSLYMFTAREDNGWFVKEACERFGFLYRNTIAIVKKNPLPHFVKNGWRSAFELCMYLTKSDKFTFNFLSQQECINVYPYLIGRNITDHPTEKPVDCFKNIIKCSSNKGDVVLDMFAGSGTTGIACIQTGRQYILIDKDEEYVNAINNRIRSGVQNEIFT